MKLLSEEFLNKYDNAPEHMNQLGAFVFYRTYSRWIKEEGRRETWKEAVARAVEYNVGISIKELEGKGLPVPIEYIREEAETLFDNVFNLRQFLSGRTHWVGGADTSVADKFPLANFNCSFLNIKEWTDLAELFYLLMVGTGVGFKSTKEFAKNMRPIRANFDIVHQPYTQRYPKMKEPETQVFFIDDKKKAVFHIGDSKEGWVDAIKYFFEILTMKRYESVVEISMHYDYIRPQGSPLKTFGGTASGYEPLKEMFESIAKLIKGTLHHSIAPMDIIDDVWRQPRPIHILDIGNLIGNNVVVGGVRRTAEIFLADSDDWEVILAKYGIYGIWDGEEQSAEEKHGQVLKALEGLNIDIPEWMKDLELNNQDARPLLHRAMSNNSIAFTEKPSREMLNLIFTIMKNEGEPGFVNLESASKRRPNAEGLNPCAEILLDSYGVCNLTTVNVDSFVKKTATIEEDTHQGYELDITGLIQAQALSARAGVRMTCLDLEIPHWDDVHKRDRLIGTSLTGWYDAMDKLGYSPEEEVRLLEMLQNVVRIEGLKYSNSLRIPTPLLDTTIKPEGTLSQVAGGVSSGLHRAHSEYFIRRIRINAQDPLAKVAESLGWNTNTEHEGRTLVIDFPVHSGASTTKDDVYVKDQFDTYFRFQEHYTAHNSSITIHVRPDEWEEAEEIVWNNWDDFVGVSFLPYDGGSYPLAPYESIDKETYEEMVKSMKEFTPEALQEFENEFLDEELAMQEMEACEGGACPIR